MFKSESEFENKLISTLLEKGWKNVLKNPTEEDLLNNWAEILYLNNRDIDRLYNYPLTKGEMQQILEKINELKTPAKLNDFINGKTVSIKRDNPEHHNLFGKEVSLKIYDRLEIAGGTSIYQIVQQPNFKSKSDIYPKRRGDLLLLINGMPVIHIELKKDNDSVGEAIFQIKKYHNEGVFTGIFALVQIFIAMTPKKTLYFANPGDYRKFNPDYYFSWADVYNNPINDWKDIASQLLSIPMAHTLIGFYTIADNTDGMLKVMRSYQYYAAKEISNKVLTTKWDDINIYGGYVWHTTGSGKTMTSFKSAELIANTKSADKVIFLVDRIELGTQSLQQYRNFAGSTNDVQATEDTNDLITKLKSSNPMDTLIVTSIQKMSNIKAEPNVNLKDITLINKKRIVFVIDEAHRSTFGEMLTTIKKTFNRAIFFGFTGTPIQDENAKKNTTTSMIFGDELHRYSIADGIRDKNVLGFDPYFVSTYKEKDLREAVILDKTNSNSLEEVFSDPKKQLIYNEFMKLPMSSTKNQEGNQKQGIEDFIKLDQYRTNEHKNAVVKDISDDWIKFSRNGKFHAIFATSSIIEAIEYYYIFKEKSPNLKVTCLFDPSDQNDDISIEKLEGVATILDDYNRMFDQKFTIPSYKNFKKDVASRLAHKDHYISIENDKNKTLDILIVVDQMLTGYDSKWVNTLYLDKILRQEHIVQAFSRTNRLFGVEKPFGLIKYYRKPYTMRKNIEEAFKTYSGDKPFGIFVDKLPENLVKINEKYKNIKEIFIFNNIFNFEKNPDNEESKRKFAFEFKELNNYLEASKIQGFNWDKSEYNFTEPNKTINVELDKVNYLVLALRYKELFSRNDQDSFSIPYQLESHLTEINTELIDNEYMNSKFTKYVEELKNNDKVLIEKTLNDLHKSFSTLSQEQQKYAGIFLDDVNSNKIKLEINKSFKDYVTEYMRNGQNTRKMKFCESYGINIDAFEVFLNEFNKSNPNEFGKYDKLKLKIDYSVSKNYLENKLGEKLKDFHVKKIVDANIIKFINEENFLF